MILNTPEDRKEIWSAIFKRKGLSTKSTGLFAQFGKFEIDVINRKIAIDANELIILCSFRDKDNFTVLSTNKIYSVIDDSLVMIKVDDISKTSPANALMAKLSEWQIMLIETNGGKQDKVLLEGGAPFIGIWNIFKNIEARNIKL